MPYDEDYYEHGVGYSGYSWERLAPYFRATAGHIKERFAPLSVLDVGCAKGFLVLALVELRVEAYGIDASAYAVSQDTTRRVAEGSATCLAFEDDTFDVVTALDVLEHIPEDEAGQACAELVRVSKEWVIARIPTQREPNDHDPTHVTIRPRHWWEALFTRLGCEVLPIGDCVNPSVWWFNVPEYLFVMRKGGE